MKCPFHPNGCKAPPPLIRKLWEEIRRREALHPGSHAERAPGHLGGGH